MGLSIFPRPLFPSSPPKNFPLPGPPWEGLTAHWCCLGNDWDSLSLINGRVTLECRGCHTGPLSQEIHPVVSMDSKLHYNETHSLCSPAIPWERAPVLELWEEVPLSLQERRHFLCEGSALSAASSPLASDLHSGFFQPMLVEFISSKGQKS